MTTLETMDTENQVSPGEETQNPAPEVETPEVATPEVEAEAKEPEAEPVEDDAEKALKRMQRRIDKRTADIYRERARAEQLAQRVAELEANSAPQVQSETDPISLAKQIARVERFTEKANSIYKEGTTAHTDYDDALKNLAAEVGHFVERDGSPSKFMDVVLQTVDNPTEVLYHLGKNPDIAEELAGLTQLQLVKRLDRIEREMSEKSKPKPSSAPKPLEPVKSKATASPLPQDEDSTEVWMKKEFARMKAKGLIHG